MQHCSDGWDRTPQLTSLSQVILDPYYRTFEGLRVLIDKDWIHFGHPFKTRSKFLASIDDYSIISEDANESVDAPIFILFLCCLREILNKNPSKFEYDENLLWCIGRVSMGWSIFGDFLCDNEKEREITKLREGTICMWKWIYGKIDYFRSKEYCKQKQHEK